MLSMSFHNEANYKNCLMCDTIIKILYFVLSASCILSGWCQHHGSRKVPSSHEWLKDNELPNIYVFKLKLPLQVKGNQQCILIHC
jgi:hypothetical protein